MTATVRAYKLRVYPIAEAMRKLVPGGTGDTKRVERPALAAAGNRSGETGLGEARTGQAGAPCQEQGKAA